MLPSHFTSFSSRQLACRINSRDSCQNNTQGKSIYRNSKFYCTNNKNHPPHCDNRALNECTSTLGGVKAVKAVMGVVAVMGVAVMGVAAREVGGGRVAGRAAVEWVEAEAAPGSWGRNHSHSRPHTRKGCDCSRCPPNYPSNSIVSGSTEG